jgi:hypothetical protein
MSEPYLEPPVQADVKQRRLVFPGEPINRDLGRYYTALREARASLREKLMPQDLALIVDTLNGTAFADASSVAALWVEVEDAIELDHLDEKWHVVSLLQSLSYLESCALVDAAERWWSRVGQGAPDRAPETALAEEEETHDEA